MQSPISKIISSWLVENDRSVRWLSLRVQCSDSFLHHVIKGSREPSAKMLRKIATVIKIPVIDLYIAAGILKDDDLVEYADKKLKIVAKKKEPYEILKNLKSDSSLPGTEGGSTRF